MARRIVSKEEAERTRTYGSIRILRDGRVRFSAAPGPVPSLEFSVQRHHWQEPGLYVYDSASYGIAACRNGETLLSLFVGRSRVESACFNINLDAATLRRAVADLLKTGNGVERWLAPGLERMREGLTKLGRNPRALKAIPGLLASLRDVPVAEEWKRQLRQAERVWKRWRAQNPDAPPTGHPMDPKRT